MYSLKSIVTDLTDRNVNDDIYVKDNTCYVSSTNDITNEKVTYKNSGGNWYVLVNNKWIDLQGGIPRYEVKENLDDGIFEDLTVEAEEIDE